VWRGDEGKQTDFLHPRWEWWAAGVRSFPGIRWWTGCSLGRGGI